MKMSDWYYILKIDYNFDETGLETNRLTLSKIYQLSGRQMNDDEL